jgi:hypothetical protein
MMMSVSKVTKKQKRAINKQNIIYGEFDPGSG